MFVISAKKTRSSVVKVYSFSVGVMCTLFDYELLIFVCLPNAELDIKIYCS